MAIPRLLIDLHTHSWMTDLQIHGKMTDSDRHTTNWITF
jgi:hypothetical protein